jgi:tetraacyldisaccharide 4'-kinase
MNLPPLIRALLWPLSVVYGAIVRLRAWLYARGWLKQQRLDAAVISVGNLTVGGTGKTPMVIWLAERFLEEGKRVAILSRGYRGADGTSDEIELMKHRLQARVSFGVGSDRFAEGRRLEPQGVDIFLLDDGFQHLQLARDVDIVLIDTTRPLRQQSLLPAGRLREPVSAVSRADLVLFTRTNHAPRTVWAMQQLPQFPVFPTMVKLIGFQRNDRDQNQSLSPDQVSGPFYAFSGIGNPEAFFLDLEKWKIPVAGRSAFRDHHRYTFTDVASLERLAARAGARAFVTTEKDAQNLKEASFEEMPVYIARISLEVPDEEEVLSLIKAKVHARRGAAA